MQASSSTTPKRALGTRSSLILLAVALVLAYIGYSALQGALQTRRDNIALVEDSVHTQGRIVDHQLYSDTSAQRKSWYKPIVVYTVDGQDYRVTAHHGVDLKGSLTEFKVDTGIEVVYPRGRPDDARVVGFEADGWIGLAIFGLCLMVLPLTAVAWGIRRRALFAHPGKQAD